MGISNQINVSVQQATPCQPGQCKTCERTGLPMLPLRRALTPDIDDARSGGNLSDVDLHPDKLRTLREGYVYVLLDKKVWQAYQVTPEGALRQFSPLQPPREAPPPLSQACIHEDHDVPASFINIDTKKYKQAQVAFANDPWPASVLNAYRNGKAPASRFTMYDLAALKADPGKVANAMALTSGEDLRSKVWEYASGAKDFASVHGFYSRVNRLNAMQAFVVNQIKHHELSQGIPVLLLPDPIGMVQEYNAVRLRWVDTMAQWAADPERLYKLFTSQALVRLKDLYKTWAEANPANAHDEQLYLPVYGEFPVIEPQILTRQEKIDTEVKKNSRRLEERYDEGQRKSFQDDYDKTAKQYQDRLDKLGARYATACTSDAWRIAHTYDYDGDDPKTGSGMAYTRMMALCLAGGPTEVIEPPQDSSQKPPPPKGPTALLWKTWLEDKNSPPYQALLSKNTQLLNGLAPSFSADGLTPNSSSKLYDAIKVILTSKEVGEGYLQPGMQHAAGVLIGAVNSAATRLDVHLKPAIKQVTGQLNSGALYLYHRAMPIKLTVQLTIGEYYTLLGEQLRQRGGELAAAGGRKVRAILLAGMVALPENAVRQRLIDVTLWTIESAEEVKARVEALRSAASQTTRESLSRVVKGVESLEPKAAQALRQTQLGAQSALFFAKNTVNGVRRMAGSSEVVLAMVSLYFQQDGLKASLDRISKAVGAEHDEAVLSVWSASVGTMAATAEVVGAAIKTLAPQASATAGAAGGESAAFAGGKALVKRAAVLSAVTGIIDGVQYSFAARRAFKTGDSNATIGYGAAAGLSMLGAGFGIASAVFASEAILLGPLGIALVLGLAAYVLVQWAIGEESTPLELWARRCYFGDHKEDPPIWWNTPAQADTAIAALNAALLGVEVQVGFHSYPHVSSPQPYVPDFGGVGIDGIGHSLSYRVVLPRYDANDSGYALALTVRRYGDRQQVLVESHHHTDALATLSAPPKHLDYDPATITPTFSTETVGETNLLVITGEIDLASSIQGGHDIEQAILHVKYFPDRTDADGFAEVTVMETN